MSIGVPAGGFPASPTRPDTAVAPAHAGDQMREGESPQAPPHGAAEDPAGPDRLPTGKIPGVVSLNVLRTYLEGVSHPGWRERFESWAEVPVLRLRCAELFPAQPFAPGTIELLMAWFQAHGLTAAQARHLPLGEAVRRLDRQAANAVPDLLDYATRVRDELDDERSLGRDDVLNLIQVRKAYVNALGLGLVRESECPESPLSRDGARRKLDALIPVIRNRLRYGGAEGVAAPRAVTPSGRVTPDGRPGYPSEEHPVTDARIEEIAAGLAQCLKRLESDEVRFRDRPLRAVGMFPEGGRAALDHLCGPHAAAAFLHIDPRFVRMLHSVAFSAVHDPTHDGPYHVYLSPRDYPDPADAERELDRQVRALRAVEPQLMALVGEIPEPHASRLLPADPENWCKVLFHLAVHRRPAFLRANRLRWVDVTGPAPGVDPERTIRLPYPCEDRWHELRFQMWRSGSRAPTADRVPGVIWSQLADDVFTSSAAAVRWLIAELRRPPRPGPGAAVVHRHFGPLYEHFARRGALDRHSCDLVASSPGAAAWLPEIQVVKVADSFRTPPAGDWNDFSEGTAYEEVWLSRLHADAEYFLYRGLASDFEQLCREAGNALPDRVEADRPVMFHRRAEPRPGIVEVRQVRGRSSVGIEFHPPDPTPPIPPRGTALNPDPVARWVRFVCNALRAHDPQEEYVRFHYPDTPAPTHPVRDLFGYVTFPVGFFAASARAIEVAGLVAEPAEAGGVSSPVPGSAVAADPGASKAESLAPGVPSAPPVPTPGTRAGGIDEIKAEIARTVRETVTEGIARIGSTAAQPPDPQTPSPRVRCDPANNSVWVDGRQIVSDLTSEQFHFVSAVAKAYPDSITFNKIMNGNTQGKNQTRIKDAINDLARRAMPATHLDFIIKQPGGVGYRLNLPPSRCQK
jgi:hypothetical protein